MRTPNFSTSLVSASVLALTIALGACATSDPDMISRDSAQTMSQVQDGVVLSVRRVTVDGSQSGVGAVVGGVVGAIGGAAGSGIQRESQVLGVLGAVAGAAAGNAAERLVTKEEAIEILVQLKGGERRVFLHAFRQVIGFRFDGRDLGIYRRENRREVD